MIEEDIDNDAHVIPEEPEQMQIAPQVNIIKTKESIKKASKNYYRDHKEEKARSVKEYRSNDPDGSKAAARRIAYLKYTFKKSPTAKRGLFLYCVIHNINKSELTIPEWQAVAEMKDLVGI